MLYVQVPSVPDVTERPAKSVFLNPLGSVAHCSPVRLTFTSTVSPSASAGRGSESVHSVRPTTTPYAVATSESVHVPPLSCCNCILYVARSAEISDSHFIWPSASPNFFTAV